MKNRFGRILSLLCAVMLLASVVSVWAHAEQTPATPTDLDPAEEETIPAEPADGPETEPEQAGEQEPGTDPAQDVGQEPDGETGQEPAENPEDESAKEQKEEPAEEREEKPAEEQEEEPAAEPDEEPAEQDEDGEEIIITKALTLGQSWNGRMSKTKHAILKLDLSGAARVYMLVEGKDVWATVEKADQQTGNPSRTETDPGTGIMVVSWSAQAGSYLITLGPVAPNRLAMATVTFMDAGTYEAWEAARAATEPEQDQAAELEAGTDEETGTEPEPAEEPETGEDPEQPEDSVTDQETEPQPEDEQDPDVETEPGTEPDDEAGEPGEEGEPEEAAGDEPAEEIPEEDEAAPETRPERHISVGVTWDVPEPAIGDTAHFKANLEGYEGLQYTMQWQNGPDKQTWYDIPGETNETMDVVVTEENNLLYWRILVYVEEDREE